LKHNSYAIILLLLLCISHHQGFSQLLPNTLAQYISESKSTVNSKNTGAIKEFYSNMHFNAVWIGAENNANLIALAKDIDESANTGLNPDDYNLVFIRSLLNENVLLQNMHDSVMAELTITDAAIHFYDDVVYGNQKPDLKYNGLDYSQNCFNIPKSLADHILNKQLGVYRQTIAPSFAEINLLENEIRKLNNVIAENNFAETTIRSTQVNKSNKQLILKLFQLGILDSVYSNIADSTLKQKLKQAQSQLDLVADGALHSSTLYELNIPLQVRLHQLQRSMNYYRWLYCLTQNRSVIVVNIPAAYMKVYSNGSSLLEMRMIVGKKSTPTPTLSSIVNEVVLYPYWHEPYSIATKELLPIIKKDPSYINRGNYQVLNMSGKIVNPYSINWNALSKSYFPYVIRQSTGCDNSLGLLKLNFDSPFGVYLHDTPVKMLFASNTRFFSHGCMRMEKPMELGRMVLKNNHIAIDTLQEKGCLLNQAPIFVPAEERMPIVVWYNPVGTDSTGRVIFYHDVYEKFRLRN